MLRVLNGSMNSLVLRSKLVSQWETEEPASKGSGAYMLGWPLGSWVPPRSRTACARALPPSQCRLPVLVLEARRWELLIELHSLPVV